MNIILVKNIEQGIERAKDILYEKVDKRTVLFLSGGQTPKSLYASVAHDAILKPACVAMIDERFGKKFHKNSNESLVKESGLLEYIENAHIPFYPIIPSHPERSEGSHVKNEKLFIERDTSQAQNDDYRVKFTQTYDQTVRDLFFHFPKSVAVMGVGADGHTAGIAPHIPNPKSQNLIKHTNHEFVTSYKNSHMIPPERITLTFSGLSLIDYFIVLVFGKEKHLALQKMFENGPMEEIPARFFNQEVSDKTVVITDQRI